MTPISQVVADFIEDANFLVKNDISLIDRLMSTILRYIKDLMGNDEPLKS